MCNKKGGGVCSYLTGMGVVQKLIRAHAPQEL